MTALLALLGFQLLVFVHELGHYLVARATGMRVIRASIGFGPALFKVTHRDIVYTVGLLPLGGLVQVAGMQGGAVDAPGAPGDFDSKPLWARAAMVFAGPAFNIGFAAALALIGFLGFKTMRWEGQPVATLVLADVDGPARIAGLLPGDAIVSIDGEPIKRLRELKALVGAAEGRPVRLGIRRPTAGAPLAMVRIPYDAEARPGLMVAIPTVPDDASALDVTVTPEKTPRGWRLGLRPELVRFGAEGVGNALAYAGRATMDLNRVFLESLGRVFRGEEKAEVAGVVKLVSVGADMIALGLADWYLDLLILISLNLALLNLLPLPALDGGRLLFLAAELVSRRRVPRRLEAWIHGAGLALLLGLVLFISGRELWELVTK